MAKASCGGLGSLRARQQQLSVGKGFLAPGGSGGMSHVAAHSTELGILVAREQLVFTATFGKGIGAVLAGNLLGIAGIATALACAQASEEV